MAGPAWSISGTVVDLVRQEIFPGTLEIADGRIAAVRPEPAATGPCLIPGFVDAHLHVESTMLPPAEFARVALTHGTVAAVCDPHEIANVCGLDGIRYLGESGRRVPFRFCWGAPPCVPATPFETSGAVITAADIEFLFREGFVRFLAEVMNVPGVLAGDPQLMAKLAVARRRAAPIDGHAPGLIGPELRQLLRAGIGTDHETTRRDEGLAKIEAGMRLLLREGSAAANLDELLPLLRSHPGSCMLCSDDLHPDDLRRGHINRMVRRALAAGVPPLPALRAASLAPSLYYDLDIGLLQPGDPATFLAIDSLRDLNVLKTFVDGRLVAEEGRTLLDRIPSHGINRFDAAPCALSDLAIPARGARVRFIEALDGQILTGAGIAAARVENGNALADPSCDLLKLCVVNRYHRGAPPACALVRGFGLREGALASSVAHDSHNIVAVGTDDAALCRAVNLVIENRGGLAAVGPAVERVLPLPIAGLMSETDFESVAHAYEGIDGAAKRLGCQLRAPFMTLSFLALPVIPRLKLTDRGLFDVEHFQFTSLFPD